MSKADFDRLLAGHLPDGGMVVLAGQSFEVCELLRVLPGRRAVARCQWNGEPVIVKFCSNDQRDKKDFVREQDGLTRLEALGVDAPRLLRSLEDAHGSGLVLQFLSGETAAELMESSNETQARELVGELFQWVMLTQQKGCMQQDMHPGNFLRYHGRWYMLDAGRCQFGVAADSSAARNNRAWLLAQFPPALNPELADLLPGETGAERGRFGLQIRAARRKRLSKMLAKAERDCTEFAEVHQGHLSGMARREHTEAISLLIGRLEQEPGEDNLIKAGNSATVWKDPDSGWIIKRYNLKSGWHLAKRQWGVSRARNSWRAGYYLRWLGVPSPEPVAYFEEHRGGLRRRAWFVCRPVDGVSLLEARPEDHSMSSVADSIAATVRLMLDYQLSHGDMKATNFLVKEGLAWVIDLDAFSFHRSAVMSRRSIVKDISRLLRNWSGGPVREELKRRITGIAGLENVDG